MANSENNNTFVNEEDGKYISDETVGNTDSVETVSKISDQAAGTERSVIKNEDKENIIVFGIDAKNEKEIIQTIVKNHELSNKILEGTDDKNVKCNKNTMDVLSTVDVDGIYDKLFKNLKKVPSKNLTSDEFVETAGPSNTDQVDPDIKTVERQKRRRRTISSNRDLKDIVEILQESDSKYSTTEEFNKQEIKKDISKSKVVQSTSKTQVQLTGKETNKPKDVNIGSEPSVQYFYTGLRNRKKRKKIIVDTKDKKVSVGILKKSKNELSLKASDQSNNNKASRQFKNKETIVSVESIKIISPSCVDSNCSEVRTDSKNVGKQASKTIITDIGSGRQVEILQTSNCELSMKVSDQQDDNKRAMCHKIIEAVFSTMKNFSTINQFTNKGESGTVEPFKTDRQFSANEVYLETKIETKPKKQKKKSNTDKDKTVIVEILQRNNCESMIEVDQQDYNQSDACSKADETLIVPSAVDSKSQEQFNSKEVTVYKNVDVIVGSSINLKTGVKRKQRRKTISNERDLVTVLQTSNFELAVKESAEQKVKEDSEYNKVVAIDASHSFSIKDGDKNTYSRRHLIANVESINEASSSITNQVCPEIKTSVSNKKRRRKTISSDRDTQNIIGLVQTGNFNKESEIKEAGKIIVQTVPPTIAIATLYTHGTFPVGEEMKYSVLKDDRTAKYRCTSEEARERERLFNDIYNEARQAAEAHRQTRQFIQKWVKPGIKLIKLCDKIEEVARLLTGENGLKAGLAFPAGCSRNNCAAHYTANTGDKTILGYDDVTKIDFGTHINGRIIDCAWTLTFNHKYDELIKAVRAATEAGIKAAGIDVRLSDVGAAIKEVMESYEVELNGKTHRIKPIHNLNGHSILPYRVHGGKIIPILRPGLVGTYFMEENEFYAIETLGSTGRGEVYKGMDVSHFMKRFDPEPFKAPLKFASSRNLKQLIETHYSSLAFCKRWLDGLGFTNYRVPLEELCTANVIKEYPPLYDIRGSFTAQFEHTIVLRPTCKEVISRGSDY